MHRTASIVLVAASLVAVPMAAVGADSEASPIFHCVIEDTSDLLSATPLESTFGNIQDTLIFPDDGHKQFEFDTASGLLRRMNEDGTFFGPLDQFEILQEGNEAYDWLVAYDSPAHQYEFFLRIRPWKSLSTDEPGRFFMIRGISEVAVGHCAPR